MHHHTATEISDTYIAWFSKIPKPLLLMVKRYSEDGEVQKYEIGSAESAMPLVRAYGLPLIALAVSIFFVTKRKSPSEETVQEVT
jgi:hypothetical protein